MESTAAGKSRRFIRTAIVLAVAAFIAILFLYWTWEGLPKAPLSTFVPSDLPMLTLDLQFIDIKGNDIPAGQTRLAGQGQSPGLSPAPGACPEIVGGDIRGGAEVKAGDRLSENCPKTARWVVKRHPIGISLYFADPKKVLSFVENNQAFNAFHEKPICPGNLLRPDAKRRHPRRRPGPERACGDGFCNLCQGVDRGPRPAPLRCGSRQQGVCLFLCPERMPVQRNGPARHLPRAGPKRVQSAEAQRADPGDAHRPSARLYHRIRNQDLCGKRDRGPDQCHGKPWADSRRRMRRNPRSF